MAAVWMTAKEWENVFGHFKLVNHENTEKFDKIAWVHDTTLFCNVCSSVATLFGQIEVAMWK